MIVCRRITHDLTFVLRVHNVPSLRIFNKENLMLPPDQIFASLAARKPDILAQGIANAQITAGGTKPTLDMVKHGCFIAARQMAIEIVRPGIKTLIANAAMLFAMTKGPRPADTVDVNEPDYIVWREQFDEAMMDAFGAELLRFAGQDFVGEFCTDSELDDGATQDKAADFAAKAIVTTAIRDRQPGQVLAEAGIVHDDFLAFVTVPAGGAASAAVDIVIDTAAAQKRVNEIVGTWALKQGAAFDMAAATDLMKGAFDDDDFLPLTYIETMGGTAADRPFFAALYKAEGTGVVERVVAAAMMTALTGVPSEIAAPPAEKPKRTTKKVAVPEVPPPPPPPPPVLAGQAAPEPATAQRPAGDDYADVVTLIREHGSTTDAELVAFVGKSRATIKNIGDGKAKCPLSPAQRKALTLHLQGHADGLALAIRRLA